MRDSGVRLDALAFLGITFVGWVLCEVFTESTSIAAGFLVGRAVRRLRPDMREVRREEWLAELDAMEGLHILRLFRAVGYFVASIRLRQRLHWRFVTLRRPDGKKQVTLVQIAAGMKVMSVEWTSDGVTTRLEAMGESRRTLRLGAVRRLGRHNRSAR